MKGAAGVKAKQARLITSNTSGKYISNVNNSQCQAQNFDPKATPLCLLTYESLAVCFIRRMSKTKETTVKLIGKLIILSDRTLLLDQLITLS